MNLRVSIQAFLLVKTNLKALKVWLVPDFSTIIKVGQEDVLKKYDKSAQKNRLDERTGLLSTDYSMRYNNPETRANKTPPAITLPN